MAQEAAVVVEVAETSLQKVTKAVAFMKKIAPKLGASIEELNALPMNGIGGQPGLFVNPTDITARFMKGNYEKVAGPNSFPSKPFVLYDACIGETDDKWFYGILFHECGHAVLHKLGRNGSGIKEANACAMELMALAMFLEERPELTVRAKKFVTARKAQSMYSNLGQYAAEAKAAYEKIMGVALA